MIVLEQDLVMAVRGEEEAAVGRLVDEHGHGAVIHEHLVRGVRG